MIPSLEIGKRALLASQRGLDVTSNNIANVNTAGYSRQALMLRPGETVSLGGTMIGMGVLTAGIRQFRDSLIERDWRTYTAAQNRYQQDATILAQIEQALGEPGDQTLQTAMQRFFDAASQLAANPSRLSDRQLFVARASDLAAQFNRSSLAIEDIRSSTFVRTTQDVERVNQLLSTIASLNRRIAGSGNASGQTAPSLTDEQTQALQELSKYLDVTAARDDSGSLTVSSNGMVLVSLDTALSLRVQKNLDSATGETTLAFSVEKPDGTTVGSLVPRSGELASLAEHYNITLNPLTTSSGFSIARELDRLARTFADRVNAIAAGGYGLNDTGPTPPARAIFVPSSGSTITASTISINSLLVTDPAAVPTSATPNTPGNSDIITAIAALATDGTFLDSMTPEGYYGSIASRLAQMGASTNDRLSAAKTILEQVNSERESLSGVNLDEEATNLITYQRSFEAAARIVTATSDMLATVINLGR
ncbi:MAG: flagellar hook-associated protein FlgK [Chlorobi bacterium]|jgi:flagellar hook-associated protein 1 FlgK|nr:flagellar hook-associated protein FlgK [Chlorobiota bacterium]